MKLDPNEQKLGFYWFIFAGTFAVVFSVVLYNIDSRMQSSDYEKTHGQMLNELRTAQTSLESRPVDSRQ